MTVSDVRKRVAEIAATVHDFENAHAMEDDLFADVLQHIANGYEPGPDDEPFDLAKEALKSREIEFARVCA